MIKYSLCQKICGKYFRTSHTRSIPLILLTEKQHVRNEGDISQNNAGGMNNEEFYPLKILLRVGGEKRITFIPDNCDER